MLLTIACVSVSSVFHQRSDVKFVISKWLPTIPIVFGLFGAVFSGWLADAKLGNYRVMKYSFVLLFFLCLLSSTFILVPDIAHYVYVMSVLYCIGGSLFIVAVVAYSITSIQLGLDQMPDASSSNITIVLLPGLYSVSMLVFGFLLFLNCPVFCVTVDYHTGLSNFTVCCHLCV